jgi:glycine/D-amino acid oxidase-like deaminating enzyme
VAGVRVHWSGSVSWGAEALSDTVRLGSDERLADAAEVGRLEPDLTLAPHRAVVRPTDGAVDPVVVTEALVDAARRHGADVRLGVAVRRLRVLEGRVVGVDTSAGAVTSRVVVLAAGVDVPTLCAPLGVDLPVAPSPALLVRFSAPVGLVRTVAACPEVEVRQTADGHLLAAGDYTGEVSRDDLQRTAQVMLRRLRDTFTGADDVRLVDVRVGVRPMPADGLPIIGPLVQHVGSYVAVMHSGVTLAPVAGRLIAAEVVENRDAEELRGVRPGRFLAAG